MIKNIPVTPIGVIHSRFSEKFGIPRQSEMVKSATAFLELLPPFNREEMVRGLDGFLHIWVHFLFHQVVEEGWRTTVRPPWLGGKKRVGIFATRSPHRPNHIGMSAVKLVGIQREKKICLIEVKGGDFLDQTPVLDIKPYVPYCDSVETATSGYTVYNRSDRLEIEVIFSKEASLFCAAYKQDTGREICLLIEEMIRQDPRPASQKGIKKLFGMLLWDVNIRWQVIDSQFQVLECRRVR